MTHCRFDTVAERDMDFLIMEEFTCSQEFADIFLSKVGKKGARLLSVQHSRRRKYVGESDIVLIFDCNGHRHALLIEDKIDAEAMPDQSGRYFKRGDWDVKDGFYDSYDVFIVAPEGYLVSNSEAILYPNRVSYEEIEMYLKRQQGVKYGFKLQMIDKALGRQQEGYQCVVDRDMMNFWDGYLKYQKASYPHLVITNADKEKGANSHWVNYASPRTNTVLRHKGKQGYIDLEFKGMALLLPFLKQKLKQIGARGIDISDVKVCAAGKSGVFRIYVPALNFLGDYDTQAEKVKQCLVAVEKMHIIARNYD